MQLSEFLYISIIKELQTKVTPFFALQLNSDILK